MTYFDKLILRRLEVLSTTDEIQNAFDSLLITLVVWKPAQKEVESFKQQLDGKYVKLSKSYLPPSVNEYRNELLTGVIEILKNHHLI